MTHDPLRRAKRRLDDLIRLERAIEKLPLAQRSIRQATVDAMRRAADQSTAEHGFLLA